MVPRRVEILHLLARLLQETAALLPSGCPSDSSAWLQILSLFFPCGKFLTFLNPEMESYCILT